MRFSKSVLFALIGFGVAAPLNTENGNIVDLSKRDPQGGTPEGVAALHRGLARPPNMGVVGFPKRDPQGSTPEGVAALHRGTISPPSGLSKRGPQVATTPGGPVFHVLPIHE